MSTAALNDNFTSVDAGILGRGDGGDDKAGQIREARMRAFYEGKDPNAVSEQGLSLRERTMMAAKKKLAVEAEAKKKVEAKEMNSMQKGSAIVLRIAWLALIPSLGLSLIWIDIHALMRMIPGFSMAFCKIGDEKLPGMSQELVGEGIRAVSGMSEKAFIVFLNIVFMLVISLFVVAALMLIDLINKLGWFFSIFE